MQYFPTLHFLTSGGVFGGHRKRLNKTDTLIVANSGILTCNRLLPDPMNGVELLGWASSLILLLTLIRQVHTQWQTRATGGVSRWLFIGQISASTGYVVYSTLLHNWVYVSSNVAILMTAFVGEAVYLRNRRAARRMPAA